MNIKRNINSYLHEHVNLYRMNKWLNMRSALFLERDCNNGILVLKEFPNLASPVEKCLSSQRSFKHAAHNFFTSVIYTLWKISCRVSGCTATSVHLPILLCLSVSSACTRHSWHSLFIHTCIISAFLHFSMFALKSLVWIVFIPKK